MTKQTVLIVEDEEKIALLLADYLKLDGFEPMVILEGTDAVEIIKRHSPSFVILDLMLPGKDGLTICQQVRRFSEVPILMLTARVDEIDRLIGLDSGADDYVCKPFLPKEVVARVKAILRRVKSNLGSQQGKSDCIEYRTVKLYPESFQCRVGEQEVELTPIEFGMLQTLITRPGRVYSRDQLMHTSYKDERIVSDRTIDSHIKNLRRKIGQYLGEEDLIHSIYGVGYKAD